MSLRRWPWSELNLDPTDDLKAIKFAYAKLLKTRRPDTDASAYQKLRAAYEAALKLARGTSEPRVIYQETFFTEVKSRDIPEFDRPPKDTAGEEAEVRVQAFLANPHAMTLKTWQEIKEALDRLPLARKRDYAMAFANCTVRDKALPIEVMREFATFFDWGTDYRQREVLGDRLHRELNSTLALREFLAQVYTFTTIRNRFLSRGMLTLLFVCVLMALERAQTYILPLVLGVPLLVFAWYYRIDWWDLSTFKVQLSPEGLSILRGKRKSTFQWESIKSLRIYSAQRSIRGQILVKLKGRRPLLIPTLQDEDGIKLVKYFDSFQVFVLGRPPGKLMKNSALIRALRAVLIFKDRLSEKILQVTSRR